MSFCASSPCHRQDRRRRRGVATLGPATLLLLVLLGGGCGGGGSASSEDLNIDIGDLRVVVTSGYAGDRVDWMVLRAYPADDLSAPLDDKRVRFENNNAFVKLPDGTTKELRGTRLLFFLDPEGVEAHEIRLGKDELDILYTEAYGSVRELIEKLVQISLSHEYD